VIYREDPRGKEYLWIGGSGVRHHNLIPGSDTEAYDAGVVSVTPLALDLWAADHTGIAEHVSTVGTRRP
jgi:5'-nucleotidase